MHRAASIMVLFIVSAGCVGAADNDPGEVSTATADSPQAEAPAGSASASSVRAEATATPADPAAPPVPVTIPLAFEGSLPAFVEPCVFAMAAGICTTGVPVNFNNRFDVDVDAEVTRARLTLTWTAAAPTTDALALRLYSFNEGEFQTHGAVVGTSPLVLEIPESFQLKAGWTHRIGVGVPSTGAGAGAAGAWVAASAAEQPFTVEGELVTLPLPNL